MIHRFAPLLLLCLICGSVHAQQKPMPVGMIVEERYRDDDLAVVMPERLVLFCRTGKEGPWHFCFAGFETKWKGKVLELEVSGSGDYEEHDAFSIAALSLDFGEKQGWSERSIVGLGKIQGSRSSHPPGWGVGTQGKTVMRENLITASPETQRVKIEVGKYAPKDWDGRLWIGLMLHNVGAQKSLRVRILNGDAAAPEVGEKQQWELVKAHQEKFLRQALKEYEKDPKREVSEDGVAEEMKAYVKSGLKHMSGEGRANQLREALASIEKSPPGAEGFLRMAEGFFEWQRGNAEAEDVAGRLNGFLKTWKETGQWGKELGSVIRLASNLEKIELGDVTSGTMMGRPGAAVNISAARNEHEGFQVVFTPLPGCSERAGVVVSDLKGPSTIARSNVTINPVGYVRIYPGQGRQRLVPDPLLNGQLVKLKPGENQPVWIDVYVPEDAAPGTYEGTVSVYADSDKLGDATPLNIPVHLKVRGFSIPKKISLRSSFWMFRDQLNRFYHVKEVGIDDYLKWIDFALAHRVNPIDVDEGHCEALVDIEKRAGAIGEKGIPDATVGEVNERPDFTKWDKYIDRMVAGGGNTLNLGTSHHFGAFFSEAKGKTGEGQIDRVKKAVGIMAEHYKEKGVFDLHYLQLRDETSEPSSVAVYREVFKAYPEVKTLLTVPSAEAKPFVRIPCPQTPGFDAKWRDEVKKSGGEYWWYVCVSPGDPYANLFTFQSAAQHRALFWQTWSHGVDGLLYWGMNFWSWYDYQWPAGAHGPSARVPGEAM
jgi:hypothetical protein